MPFDLCKSVNWEQGCESMRDVSARLRVCVLVSPYVCFRDRQTEGERERDL